MAKRNIIGVPDDQPEIKSPPVMTDEAREQQLTSLALDLVEQRLRNGTASAQETVHFLRLASSKEKIEKEILKAKKELVVAQTSAIESQERNETLYADAIKAFRTYSGQGDDEE